MRLSFYLFVIIVLFILVQSQFSIKEGITTTSLGNILTQLATSRSFGPSSTGFYPHAPFAYYNYNWSFPQGYGTTHFGRKYQHFVKRGMITKPSRWWPHYTF